MNLPGLMGFVQYCAYNPSETARLYGGTFLEKHVSSVILDYIEGMEKVMIRVLKDNGFHAPLPFQELVKLTDGVISTGNKMGEGLAPHRRDDRAGAGRVREHRLRPAIRLPAQPHLRQGDDQQDPGAVPPRPISPPSTTIPAPPG